MNIIEVLLFAVVLIFGTVLLFARFGPKPKLAPVAVSGGNATVADQRSIGERSYAKLYDWAHSLFGVLLFVFIFRSFVFEPFRIPSGSMIPTLLEGDFVAVKKWSYGVRLPIVHKKILETSEPQRGDVVVFRYPPKPSQAFIKRLIGLPGDTVRYADKKLTVNGKAIDYDSTTVPFQQEMEDVYWESLGDEPHLMQNVLTRGARSFTLKVPEGKYFMMGDNRDNSLDSRSWGFVPDENLVGKAVVIWVSFGKDFPFVRVGRIGGIE